MMKAKGVVGIVLIAFAALGAGYWLGHRAGGGTPSQLSKPSPSQDGAGPSRAPKQLSQRTKAQAVTTSSEDPKPSLAEIEEKFSSAKERIRPKEWERILDSLNAQDFPGLLAAAEKNPSKSIRDGIRAGLLTRWAASDPTSAMEYANSIAGKKDKENAILAVLRGWAEKDAEAAAAWAKQIP